jgi:O2-independent ubiquinone biosynthesis protein UbiV
MSSSLLTLGPVLFHWTPAVWRDFHFRIADEAPVDEVYLGETVCSKRAPAVLAHIDEVAARLTAAGKRVIRSSPILVTSDAERAALRELAASGAEVEANDLGAVALLAGTPYRVGPTVNVYNEGSLEWMAGRGVTSVTLNAELPAESVGVLAETGAALGVGIEVQVFGRMPLAISARCYHARAHGLHKDECRHVCGQDADGLAVDTLDKQAFLAINGTQTLSHACLNLAGDLGRLQALGVGRFRLSPHSGDMVRAATVFRDALDGRIDPAEAASLVTGIAAPMPVANGFLHGREGAATVS